MTRIVLDTNVLVSAFLSPAGAPAQVWSLVEEGAVQLCVDQRIMFEYHDVLSRPEFKIPVHEVNSILAFIEDAADVVIASPLPLLTSDPDDQKFVEVALSAQADFLVTGNLKHFSGLSKHGLRVVSPRVFLDEFLV
jgi:uncharacterized protein